MLVLVLIATGLASVDYVHCGVKYNFIGELSQMMLAIRLKMREYGHKTNMYIYISRTFHRIQIRPFPGHAMHT